jgi:hypothetical protein
MWYSPSGLFAHAQGSLAERLTRGKLAKALTERIFAVVITQTGEPSREQLALTTMQAPLWLEQLYLPGKPIANTGLSVILNRHTPHPAEHGWRLGLSKGR